MALAGCLGSAPLNYGIAGVSTSQIAEAFPIADKATEVPSGPRLVVNDESVGPDEIWWELHASLRAQASALSPSEYDTYVNQEAARLITDKIAEMLLYQRAKLKLPPGADDQVDRHVDAAIRRIIETEFEGIERRFKKSLESQGITLEQKRALLRREILISSYLEQQVRPHVPEPTRAELLEAYAQVRAEADRHPPRRRMSLIDVRITDRLPDANDEPTRKEYENAKSEALERIQTARAELTNGRPFLEVARTYSDGLHAAEGGAWGWITQGSVRERFEPAVDALFQLDQGKVSDIIETDDGFFLVRCDEIEPGMDKDFQALQPQLAERFFRNAYNREIVKLVNELRQKARIQPANLEEFHSAVVRAVPVSPLPIGSPPDAP